MGKDVSKIQAIAEPIAAERRLEVLDVEWSGSGSRQLLRIFLDSAEEARPVSIEDCEAVSRRLGDALDAHEAVRGHYMLEVSSPGVNRSLKRPEHFRRAIGSKARVRLVAGDGDRRSVIGRIGVVDDGGVTIDEDGGATVRLAFEDIEKANLEYEFEPPRGPRPRRR